jgi:hypothetical protein
MAYVHAEVHFSFFSGSRLAIGQQRWQLDKRILSLAS